MQQQGSTNREEGSTLYAPPKADLQERSVQTGDLIGAATLTRWVKRFLYANVVLAVVGMISGGLELKMLLDLKQGAPFADEVLVANDMRQASIGLLQLVVRLACFVLVGLWIYRANKNARRLGAEGMTISPGWSVGWYFIPIANLWQPLKAMQEIWCASADPAHWKSQRPPGLMYAWWAMWVISIILGNIAFSLARNAESLDNFIAANLSMMAADTLEIPLTLSLIILVRRLYLLQHADER